MISISALIEYQAKQNLSDMHFVTGEIPLARNHSSELVPLDENPLSKEQIDAFITELCTKEEKAYFLEHGNMDMAKDLYGKGRFRVNLFTERRGMGMNIRIIPDFAEEITATDIPPTLLEHVRRRKGLMLISGPNNAGKTTLMNKCIDVLNSEQKINIITFEDPIEFIHERKQALISQREITKGSATEMRDDLKSVFRQDADVVCIGEIRDSTMMQLAIEMCETGYFVMATIHSTNVIQTLMRIVNLYESENRSQFLSQLADQLSTVVCQYLVPGKENNLIPCREILVPESGIRNLLRMGEFASIRNQMEVSGAGGNILFDHYLVGLYENGLITQETLSKYTQNAEMMAMLTE